MGSSSRRRNPNEFGSSRGRVDGGRCMRHESYRHLELDEALARGAHDPTTPRDYARAADELAIVLETCFRASDKATAAAMYESALLAARLSSGVDTAAQADAAERVRRPRAPFSPPRARAAFEAAFKRASVERARRARRVESEARERVDDPDRGIVVVDLPETPWTSSPRASNRTTSREWRARPQTGATRSRARRNAGDATPRTPSDPRDADASRSSRRRARVGRGCMSRRVVAALIRGAAGTHGPRAMRRVSPRRMDLASARALCRSRVFDVLRIAVVSTRPARGCAPGRRAGGDDAREGRLVRRLVRHVVRKFGQRERRGRGRTEAPATSAVERAGRGEVLGRRTVRVVVQQTSLAATENRKNQTRCARIGIRRPRRVRRSEGAPA